MTARWFLLGQGGHEECNDFQPHRSDVMLRCILPKL
jgi:hypothetical protein